MDVALVTCEPMNPLAVPEHALLSAALARLGHRARDVAWDATGVDWASFDLAVIRSTWDYVPRRDEFVAWARRVPRLANPADVIAWNSHKGYLRELEGCGVPIVPTEWIAKGSRGVGLGPLLSRRGWSEAILKPAVSAGAHRTVRFRGEGLSAPQALLEEILLDCDAMVQPYLATVESPELGERSLMFIEGRLSHAVRRESYLKTGRHGFSRMEPEEEDVALAQRVLAAAPPGLLYARVDLARDAAGGRRLMELEVVEPSLFLEAEPLGAERLAAAIHRRALGATPGP